MRASSTSSRKTSPATTTPISARPRVSSTKAAAALREHFTIRPVRSEAEGSRVTIAGRLRRHAIRLTGNVVGSAPFTVSHRGWRVERRQTAQAREVARREGHHRPRWNCERSAFFDRRRSGRRTAPSYVELAAGDGEDRAGRTVTQLTAPGAISRPSCCPRFSICRTRANSRPAT
jgi:hypothetical protein